MLKLTRSQSATLTLAADVEPASRWEAYPPTLDLVPAPDGRSCVARLQADTPIGIGRWTVKAVRAADPADVRSARWLGVGWFSLHIVEDAREPAAPAPVESRRE
jgi:hypothetical protein